MSGTLDTSEAVQSRLMTINMRKHRLINEISLLGNLGSVKAQVMAKIEEVKKIDEEAKKLRDKLAKMK